jgi:hypothetical protein
MAAYAAMTRRGSGMTERNLDLIRNVLLEIVKLPFANNGGYDLRDLAAKFATDEASEDIVCYHLKLLKDANYFMFTSDEKYMNGISWIGHDFIDLVRDPEAWKKADRKAHWDRIITPLLVMAAEAAIHDIGPQVWC